MKMPPSDAASLRDRLREARNACDRHFWAAGASVALGDLERGSSLGGRIAELDGKSVLLATGDQLTTALALVELDGVARRLVLCPPDVPAEHYPAVIANAGVDAIVSDGEARGQHALGVPLHVVCDPAIRSAAIAHCDRRQTEWVLFTSGTTGVPKMVMHSLAGLTAAIKSGSKRDDRIVWATFYDIRRYGGLQIFLRAVLDGGSLVLSSAKEPTGEHLVRLGAHGVTHISGTPSHWRRALMSPAARAISPRYIRLSGEIADQAILDNLRAFYPQARIGHAYASTEAGVGFDVNDGLAGFPASMIGERAGDVEMKVEDASLRIRSTRAAVKYVGGDGAALAGADGFVDTGDIVELRGDRYHFVGRRGGIINVGGLKVHPEEVEAVINRHPDVRMSLVRPRKNPITGSIVVAEVVLTEAPDGGAGMRSESLKREILQLCREALAQYKVPAAVHFVPTLAVAATGKLVRHHA
jgi:acyl-coenzyme A synthetase/AMP-(fatty) acid ligase